ncbi:DUF5984 family protein [Nonomuraea sp. NPDC002799]
MPAPDASAPPKPSPAAHAQNDPCPAGTRSTPAHAAHAERRPRWDFGRQVITDMEERIAELERRGAPAGVELDLGQLRTEHVRRAAFPRTAMSRVPATDVAEVVQAGVGELGSRVLGVVGLDELGHQGAGRI